ncbi:hypothetical protein V493_06499 [Pseudogymnoascus sp. VKM F-4281 (FW-2241)]|nr:hypothetical protein V493_06499 [Pseudogymnoascus sp. VKM F-4281 (FW-2241)]
MGADKAVDTRSIQELLQTLAGQEDSVAKDHLKKLIQDASQPRHMSGNSCTRLCYFLEQCRKSEAPKLRALAYSHETCQQLFNFYVEWNEKNQHRSMRQVLELLSSLISHNPDKAVSNGFKTESLERLLSIISHESAQPLVKPAFKVLECFVIKGTYNSSDLFEAFGRISGEIEPTRESQWDKLVSGVFEWMSPPETCSAAAKFLVSLFGELKTSPIEGSEATGNYSIYWQRWIQQGLGKHPESLENVKNYLFPPLFKLDRSGSLQFLRNISENNAIDTVGNREADGGATLFLSALEVGKKYGLVDDPDLIPPQKASAKQRDFVELPIQAIGGLLIHTDTTVRSLAFSVLVSSLSSTRPFPKESLDIIRRNLYVLHADTDAKFRNDLFASTKHMLERLRGALALLTREASLSVTRRQITTDPNSPSELQTVHNTQQIDKEGSNIQSHIQEHEHFLSWYLSFLAQELVPTASYPRHITALKSFEILLKTGVQPSPGIPTINSSRGSDTFWPKQINVFSPSVCRLLLDLVLDPFEEVRNCSVSVLNSAPKDCFGPLSDTPYGPVPQLLQDLLSEAKMASSQTGRADAADGLAHMNVLHFKVLDNDQHRLDFFQSLLLGLEDNIEIASSDLDLAADTIPLHGQLTTLTQLWDLMKVSSYGGLVAVDSLAYGHEAGTIGAFQYRLGMCCINIWQIAKDTLCHDSPEGHDPSGPIGSDDADVKGVLSFSFRACHESSELIQAILRKINDKSSDGKPFLTFNLVQMLGNLTFVQLASLRHRGAFSTVTTTFSLCCKVTRSKSLIEAGGQDLLRTWHDRAFQCINEQHSTTRRSAGLPGLITGILSAGSTDVTLDSVMVRLQEIARTPVISSGKDEEQLPQVHAMNSIKDVFKSATLGKQADMYVTDCFIIATDSLKSNIWAISNCGLILVKSLLDCMLGTSDNKAATEAGWDGRSIRISYNRYKGLPELLLGLLKMDSSIPAQTNLVFPALEFARRVGPPEKDRVQFREDFYNSVIRHLNCPIWTFRDLAARTASTFLLEDNWTAPIIELLESKSFSTNGLHGIFLLIRYLIEKRLDLERPLTKDDLIMLLKAMSIRILRYGANPTDKFLIAAYEEAMFPIYQTVFKDMPGKEDSTFPFSSMEWVEQGQAILDEMGKAVVEELNQHPLDERNSLANNTQIVHLLYIIRMEKSLCRITDGSISWEAITDDAAAELLQRSPKIFTFSSLTLEEIVSMIRFFQSFVRSDKRSEKVKRIAHTNIADLLGLHDLFFFSDEQIKELAGLLLNDSFLSNDPTHIVIRGGVELQLFIGPGLRNAQLRTRGHILRLHVHAFERLGLPGTVQPAIQEKRIAEILLYFGMDVLRALHSDNDYDTRIAAAAAFYNFYDAHADIIFSAAATGKNILCLLPLNIAILDSLTDDDPDIREIGAATFSSITFSPAVVPEASAQAFSHWLYDHYSTCEQFLAETLRRITSGNTVDGFTGIEPLVLPDTRVALMHAMVPDNALFAEEEQNLYIDEMREARLWCGIFARAEGSQWDRVTAKLVLWAVKSMRTMMAIEDRDGPLGWMSKPKVFAICARVVVAARMLAERFGTMEGVKGKPLLEPVVAALMEAGRSLLERGRTKSLHPLLMEELGTMAASQEKK